ncbi:hypothetical protein [Puniceibacterium sp. IMCC21224]|uniref:hypothetical protein n=1 Tax=Puniceibacterium sp. IMCC21224 TaxID=1618204 RepID=UPI00064D7D0F|nr:hypothetical protein [Puniceibacterium sp. IMCC21224]KMK63787.1 hypothetical protein IMCC21224_1922 [Puniceibacterium sp. IMCC21224]
MSAHSSRAIGRHPDPVGFRRERWPVGHVNFEVIDHPQDCVTFALRADVDRGDGKLPPALFSAHVPRGMATQLRKLAHRLDELEGKL